MKLLIIIAEGGGDKGLGMLIWKKSFSYLRVQLIDHFNGLLYLARVNPVSNPHTFLDSIIGIDFDIGFDGKLVRGGRVSSSYEVIHHEAIDVTGA